MIILRFESLKFVFLKAGHQFFVINNKGFSSLSLPDSINILKGGEEAKILRNVSKIFRGY